MTFALDLQRFAEKVQDKADEAVSAIMIGIAARIDERSPVGDMTLWKDVDSYGFDEKFATLVKERREGYVGGHFRANWQLGVDVIPEGEVVGTDPTGEATQGRIVAAIPDEASGHVYWLANNAPYARRLEEGWSTQAPQGMVGLTVIEFQAIVREAIAKVKGGGA